MLLLGNSKHFFDLCWISSACLFLGKAFTLWRRGEKEKQRRGKEGRTEVRKEGGKESKEGRKASLFLKLASLHVSSKLSGHHTCCLKFLQALLCKPWARKWVEPGLGSVTRLESQRQASESLFLACSPGKPAFVRPPFAYLISCSEQSFYD